MHAPDRIPGIGDFTQHSDLSPVSRRTLWLTGASGFLGAHLIPLLPMNEWRLALIPGRHPLPGVGAWTLHTTLTDDYGLRAVARGFRPDVIIHTAAISTVAACRQNPQAAWEVNVRATRMLAALARDLGAHLIHISTDMVFSGEHAPYAESATPSPLSVYGYTKAAAEEAVQASGCQWTILRCPLMYGLARHPWHQNHLELVLRGLRGTGEPPTLFRDEWRSLADVRQVARTVVTAARRQTPGVYHLGGPERLSRAGFARLACSAFGIDPTRVREGSVRDAPGEPRPSDLTLISDRARAELSYHHPPVAATLEELADLLAVDRD